jgi:hypothetical protein
MKNHLTNKSGNVQSAADSTNTTHGMEPGKNSFEERKDKWSNGTTWICKIGKCHENREVFMYWSSLIHHLWVYHGIHLFSRKEIEEIEKRERTNSNDKSAPRK